METVQTDEITAAVQDYRRRLLEQRQRGLVVLSGGQEWCREQALRCLSSTGDELWLGSDAPAAIESCAAAQAVRYLGQERGDVVLDAWAGFDADALGAISGTLRAGQLLFLLTPAFDAWPDYDDPEHARITVEPYATGQVGRRFVRHVMHELRADLTVLRIAQDGVPVPRPVVSPSIEEGPGAESPYRSLDQAQAVEALLHVVTGHRRRPLVLTSDRGRGKSSALGLAAAELLRQGRRQLIVTAPSLASCEVVFGRIAEALPEAEVARGHIRWQGAEVRFMPPDELVRQAPVADMVMVDEAAAIPVALLTRMLQQHSRIAFATTVHGYEGTGRGFELRFKQTLEAMCPQWRELVMITPIRWAAGDPLEGIVYRLLLLDAEVAPLHTQLAEVSNWTIEHLGRERLWQDRTQLAQLFGLLVNAHYRTRPYDLRHLLDAPNVELFAMRQAGAVVGVVVAVHEGQAGQAISEQIYRGERRLHGHLLPQSLLAHAGERGALQYRYLRIMRIAVHPQRRRCGLGTSLLDHVADWAREQRVDLIGASFGAAPGLLSFWLQLGMQPVRVGFRREASSGSHAVMMLQPLSVAADAFYQQLRGQFVHELPYLLAEPLQEMEAEVVPLLLRHDSPGLLSRSELKMVEDFAAGRRDYETTLAALWRFLAIALSHWDRVEQPQLLQPLALLVMKVWQHHSFSSLADVMQLSGRRGVLEAVRDACTQVRQSLIQEPSPAKDL